MALAATGSEELVQQVYSASGAELKSVGINWSYAPVGDVNSDPKNPVIGVRSFGDDPNKVAMLATSASQAFQAAGVAATGKHFPGHGDTAVDSHLALPLIYKTKEEIAHQELIPFGALIEAGVASIMTGHMAFPKLTGTEEPCSLSRVVTTDLLKEEMGFKGVVVTDCLEMDAIADVKQGGCGVEEGALRAIKAGADIVMICHTFECQKGAIERVLLAAKKGEMDMEELEKSAARVRKLKGDYAGDWNSVLSSQDEAAWKAVWEDLRGVNIPLSQDAYSRSIVVLQNQGAGPSIVPLDRDALSGSQKRILLLTPEEESVNRAVDSGEGNRARRSSFEALERALAQRVAVTHQEYKADENPTNDLFEGVGVVIIALRNADLRRWQLGYLEQICIKVRERDGAGGQMALVVLSVCGPYELGAREVGDALKTSMAAAVATFEFTAEAFDGAASVLFGTREGLGRMPVRLS